MTAWELLQEKGTGADAFAILYSDITATSTYDALLKKSSEPAGATTWAHLGSILALLLNGTLQTAHSPAIPLFNQGIFLTDMLQQQASTPPCVEDLTEEERLRHILPRQWSLIARNSWTAEVENAADCED